MVTPLGALCLLFEDEVLVCAVRGSSGAFEKINVDGAGLAWLYFHVGPTEIRNDDFAKERFEAGDAAAFGNFYDIICDPQRTYSMYDVANTAVTLAGPMFDKVQDAFARQTGQRAIGKLGTYICFNPGIKDASRRVLTAFLEDKGFDVLGVVDYHEVILTGLQGRGVIGPTANVALVTASFGDLRFEYLKCTPDEVKHQSEVLPGKGEDARVQVLAELMVDKVAKKNASQLLNYPDLLQAEIKRFYRYARTNLNKFEDGELRVRVTLSDGATGVPVIDERDVSTPVIPKFRHADDKLRAFIGTALNLPKTDRIVIACGALDTDDFVSLLARAAGAAKILRVSGDLLSLQLLGLGNVVSRAEAARAVPAPVDAEGVRAPTAPTTAPSVPVITAPPPAPPMPVSRASVSPTRPALPPLPAGGPAARPAIPPMPSAKRVSESPPHRAERTPALPPLPAKMAGSPVITGSGVNPSTPRQTPPPPPLPPRLAPKATPTPPGHPNIQTQYLVYWTPKEIETALANGLLSSAASSQPTRVCIGDRLWICGLDPSGDLITIGFVDVAAVQTYDQRRALLINGQRRALLINEGRSDLPFDRKFHWVGDERASVRARVISLKRIWRELSFQSETAPHIRPNATGKPNGQSMQTIRRLTEESARLLYNAWLREQPQ